MKMIGNNTMAFQDISEPSQVMVHEIAATRAFFARVGAAFGAVGRAVMVNRAMERRLETVEALQAKSDAELAKLNIKRDEIVQHVFRDLLYV
tara:strand:- start:4792 stop:5067 length:276 start_codon:yes stop_codon:yes gene_type:complete